MLAATITDRADGQGVNVLVAGTTPGSAVRVEYRDAADPGGTERTGPSGTGDGLYVLALGNGEGQITPGRAYSVRAAETVLGATTVTPETVVQATLGYGCLQFRLLVAAKTKAIRLALPKIGGNVYHCLDVEGFYGSAVPQPALVVFPAVEEWGPVHDNLDSLFSHVTQLVVTDTNDNDWVSNVEWWLAVRERLLTAFHRKPVDPDAGPDGSPRDTFGGRRWRVRFGPVAPLDKSGRFPYRYQTLTLLADSEI